MENSKLKIKYVKLTQITPCKANPRVNNDEAVEKVANSISNFGFKQPIIVDKNMEIIAGHTRYKAAIGLQLEEVPIIIAEDLTEEQVKALRIADNKTAEFSEWDNGLLKDALKELEEVGFDLDSTGFDFTEIDKLLNADAIYVDEEPKEEETGYIIQYNIIFNDEEEQKEWHEYLKRLKDKYPDLETISERIVADINDKGYDNQVSSLED